MAINIKVYFPDSFNKVDQVQQKNPEKKWPDRHFQVLYYLTHRLQVNSDLSRFFPSIQASEALTGNWETARVLRALASAKQAKAQFSPLAQMCSSQTGVLLVPRPHAGLGMHLCFKSNQISEEKLGNQATVTSWKSRVTADKPVHTWGRKETKAKGTFLPSESVIEPCEDNSKVVLSVRGRWKHHYSDLCHSL